MWKIGKKKDDKDKNIVKNESKCKQIKRDIHETPVKLLLDNGPVQIAKLLEDKH